MTTPPLFPEDDAFDDVRLPLDIEQGAQIGPTFQTTIIQLTSGREQRNADWSQELLKADIGYGLMNDISGDPLDAEDRESSFREILAFFRARRGQWRAFRFRDWSDYQAEFEPLGVGDGTRTEFQLVKSYDTYVRRITRPVSGTIEVFVDGVSAPFTVGAKGLVVMNAAPADMAIVTATYEFDVPMRFQSDVSQVQLTWARAGQVPSIQLIGVRE